MKTANVLKNKKVKRQQKYVYFCPFCEHIIKKGVEECPYCGLDLKWD